MTLIKFLSMGLSPYEKCEVLVPAALWEGTAADRERLSGKHEFVQSDQAELIVRFRGQALTLSELLVCATTLQAELSKEVGVGASFQGIPGSRYYNILATPRSGSDMLCSIFDTTKELGAPREFLNQVAVSLINDGVIDLPRWLKALARRLSERNRSQFGLKFATDDIEAVLPGQSTDGVGEFWKFVREGRIITLRRRDRRAQALSWLVGRKTGIFNRKTPLTEEEKALCATTRTSIGSRELDVVVAEMDMWEKRYIAPVLGLGVDLLYEDIAGPDRQQHLDRVYDYLGVVRREYEATTIRVSS